MSKFELNEIVLCVKAGKPEDWDFGAEEYFGTECEIIGLNSGMCAWGVRHRVKFQDGITAQLTEDFLRKRPDPGLERHLAGCKPYDKSYEETLKELGHVTEETVRRTFVENMWSTK